MFTDLPEDAARQYIDSAAALDEWLDARREARQLRGGMYWKTVKGLDYLVRTATDNSQKSLGQRSPDTEAMYARFVQRKSASQERLARAGAMLERHRRMNRALRVGRAPKVLVDVLARLQDDELADHFIVVGTHALYAYEAAAGVRIQDSAALATRDVDLLWDTSRRLSFFTRLGRTEGGSMISVLQKVDKSFRILPHQTYTARNAEGFEVDILRREAVADDPHPIRLSADEDDFWVVQARKAAQLGSAPRLTAMVVSTSGTMARMTTVRPEVFVTFKRWMATQRDRDPLKRRRDRLQAGIVEALANDFLPPPL